MSSSTDIVVSWNSQSYRLAYNDSINTITVGSFSAASPWIPSIKSSWGDGVLISFLKDTSVHFMALDYYDNSLVATEDIWDALEVQLVPASGSNQKLLVLRNTARNNWSSDDKLVAFCEQVDGRIRFVSQAKSVELELQGRGHRVFLNVPKTDWFDKDLSTGMSSSPLPGAEGLFPSNFRDFHVPSGGVDSWVDLLSRQHLDVILIRVMCTILQLADIPASFDAIRIDAGGAIVNPGVIVGQATSSMGYIRMFQTFAHLVTTMRVDMLQNGPAFIENMNTLNGLMDRLMQLRAGELDPGTDSYETHLTVIWALSTVLGSLELLYRRFQGP